VDRKQRPTAVDTFRHDISEDSDAELLRITALPNIGVPDIHRYLVSIGYNGSLRSCYTWYTAHKKIGEQAKIFNELLKDYEGVAAEKVLQKLTITFSNQLDIALAKIAPVEGTEASISQTEYLKAIPQLGREVRSCVQAINQLESIRDRRGLELAGAYRMAQELKLIFAGTPYEKSLEAGIKTVVALIEGEE